jgi:hemolysin activation/secretion protein
MTISTRAARTGAIGRACSAARLLLGAASLGTLALAQSALAQNAADVAPPTREELTPGVSRAVRDAVTLTVDGQMERRSCVLDNPQYADLKVTLSAVNYTGAERAAEVALAQAHEGYLGRELPIRALCDIRDRAAALLDAGGYLAAVEIPPQNLGQGTAEMRVVLGRLVAVRARGEKDGAERLLANYLGKLLGADVFNVADAERYLLLANDIPGTEVRLSLRPAEGGAPGDLVGEVAVLSLPMVADVSLQNLGSRAVGRVNALARVEFFGLTGAGDRTSVLFFSTADFKEQQTLQLAHDFLIGGEGLRLGGQLTLGWTTPSALAGFVIKSDTLFASLEASYPFLRTQVASVWGAAGFDLVDQDVTVNGFDLTRDRVRTAYARANFQLFDRASISRRGGYSPSEPRLALSGEAELRKGLDVFGTVRDCRGALLTCVSGGATPPARIEQNPTPFYVRGNLSAEFRPAPHFGFTLGLRGQISGEALPSFEEFAAGNYTIGRGFDPASVLGDSGIGGSLELHFGALRPSSADAFVLQPYVFTDAARSWQQDPALAALGSDQLWSAGGGLRFVRGSSLQGDLSVAVPLHRTDAQTNLGNTRVLFTLTARLLPWSL